MSKLVRKLQSFRFDKRASAAVMFALVTPVMIGFTALAVDVGKIYLTEAELQNAVDETALAGLVRIRDTRTSFAVGVTEAQLTSDMVQFAIDSVPDLAGDAAVRAEDIVFGRWDFNTEEFTPTNYWLNVNAVRVAGHMTSERGNPLKTYFGALFTDHVEMRVSSMAVLPVPPGFHSLSQAASPGFYWENSDLDTSDIVVNSTSDNAALFSGSNWKHSFGGHQMDVAGRINSVGRPLRGAFKVHAQQFGVRDFLENQPQPQVSGGCEYRDFEPAPQSNKIILRPGTYCGLLIETPVDEVEFQPGTYIFKDKPVVIRNQTRVDGEEGVHFYFTGEDATLTVINVQDIVLRARDSGDQKGITIMTNRNAGRAPRYISFMGSKLTSLGVIYLPASSFQVANGTLNGNCVILCVAADTMAFTNLFVNYYGGISSLRAPGWNLSSNNGVTNPVGLGVSFRPYLIE
ncbi:TadE/TadG family type IV pilus assembly protein [Hoeflea poritis]|uniref:Pilus assembly protein n=1 Tax=Hoeflea poritis TaxID=2993659 RepID=A0ABT4VXX4_9HYPH|nr:TadE/TadG family type IV pilus assembly protein [Hoeflea poritis]MDA4848858.1 pilus assembly protein [Hoeflea poritis]